MKILFDMRHGLGDTVHALPMLQRMRELHPDWHFAVMVRDKANQKLIELSKIQIDSFVFFHMAQSGVWDLFRFLFGLRQQKFDYLILSPITERRKARLLGLLSGAKHLIGEQYQKFAPVQLDDTVHLVDRNMLLLKSFSKEYFVKRRPVLQADEQDVLIVKKMLGEVNGPLLVLNVGNASPSRYQGHLVYTRGWGVEHIRKLAECLLQQHNIELCLLGGPDELEYRDSLVELCNNPCVHEFIGRLDIGQSVALAQIADLVIGVDTGMQHIADAAGTKTVSIFGPTNPRTHGAYSAQAAFVQHPVSCQYCYTRKDYYTCAERLCLQKITVDDVLNVILSVMGKTSYSIDEAR